MWNRTKLDQWCDGALEAGWLAALILAPLFFNVFSSRVFEPDKISLVRSIALAMIAVWLVKVVNGGYAWLPAADASSEQRSSGGAWRGTAVAARPGVEPQPTGQNKRYHADSAGPFHRGLLVCPKRGFEAASAELFSEKDRQRAGKTLG
jgi:hypothetical protein